MQLRPYFMQNEEWYVTPEKEGIDDLFYDDGRGYHLTDKAPQEAIDSYNEFYGEPAFCDSDGNSLHKDGFVVVA